MVSFPFSLFLCFVSNADDVDQPRSSARTSFGREQCRVHTVCLQMDELLAYEGVERQEYRADVGYLFGTSFRSLMERLLRLSCINFRCICHNRLKEPMHFPNFISTFVWLSWSSGATNCGAWTFRYGLPLFLDSYLV